MLVKSVEISIFHVNNRRGALCLSQGSRMGYPACFSCDQAALRTPFFCLSVRPSVCHPFFTMFFSLYRHEILWSYYHWQTLCPCKMSKSEVKGQGHKGHKTQLSRFRTVTAVWIHIWWWNDAQSLMILRRGVLLFMKVIRQISRSYG